MISSIRCRGRSIFAAAAVATVVAGAAAAPASASSYVYHDSFMGQYSEIWSNTVALTSSEGASYTTGFTICVASLDSGFNVYGQVQCTNNQSGTGKPYDGSQRRAYARPAYGDSGHGKGRAVYN